MYPKHYYLEIELPGICKFFNAVWVCVCVPQWKDWI